LFSYADKSISLDEFATYLLETQRREKPTSVSSYIENKYEVFVTSEITRYEDSQLESKYPEFKTLMQEYQDGILIFEIMQNEIWNKASKDSAGLVNYYTSINRISFFQQDTMVHYTRVKTDLLLSKLVN